MPTGDTSRCVTIINISDVVLEATSLPRGTSRRYFRCLDLAPLSPFIAMFSSKHKLRVWQ